MTKNKITIIILFVMLLIRLADVTAINWIFGSRIPDWAKYLYSITIYTLIVLLLWSNRERLFRLNIDRPFLGLLLITGAVLFLWYLPVNVGLYILILMGFLVWTAKHNFIVYESIHISPLRLGAYILIGLTPLFIVLLFSAFKNTPFPTISRPLLYYFLNANLPGVVFEEVLFRGLLWMVLVDMKVSDQKVIYIQAFAFWLAHYDLFIEQRFFSFWVLLPFAGLFYGYIVNKNKSITPTIICHFVLNFFISISA